MRLPTPLLRRNRHVHKNTFGHALIIAGSPQMLGAAALTGLACMRSGAGLVTIACPRSLNDILQKKISNVIMSYPLPETSQQTLSRAALKPLARIWDKYAAIALGPGLSHNAQTTQLIRSIIKEAPIPLILDADVFQALKGHLGLLTHTSTPKILTPHLKELSRFTGLPRATIMHHRARITQQWAKRLQAVLLLKGPETLVAGPQQKLYRNPTGNAGMATAGSGDVLTGMIAAFVAQGLAPFDAAKYGAYLHGLAGDLAAKDKTRLALLAPDIIEHIPAAIRSSTSQ